jgi:hypothetical protein
MTAMSDNDFIGDLELSWRFYGGANCNSDRPTRSQPPTSTDACADSLLFPRFNGDGIAASNKKTADKQG